MKISVSIQGVDGVISKLGAKQQQAQNAVGIGIGRVAILFRDTALQYARAGHPDHPNVISGRLSSIKISPFTNKGSETSVEVGPDAEYAQWVEFGHTQQPGRYVPAIDKKLVATEVKPYPFMRPAIADVFYSGKGAQLFKNVVQQSLR